MAKRSLPDTIFMTRFTFPRKKLKTIYNGWLARKKMLTAETADFYCLGRTKASGYLAAT